MDTGLVVMIGVLVAVFSTVMLLIISDEADRTREFSQFVENSSTAPIVAIELKQPSATTLTMELTVDGGGRSSITRNVADVMSHFQLLVTKNPNADVSMHILNQDKSVFQLRIKSPAQKLPE